MLKKASESQQRVSFADASNPTWTPAPNEGIKENIIIQGEVVMQDDSNKGVRQSLPSAIIIEESRVSVTRETTGQQESEMNQNNISPKIVSEGKASEPEMEMNQTGATPVEIV